MGVRNQLTTMFKNFPWKRFFLIMAVAVLAYAIYDVVSTVIQFASAGVTVAKAVANTLSKIAKLFTKFLYLLFSPLEAIKIMQKFFEFLINWAKTGDRIGSYADFLMWVKGQDYLQQGGGAGGVFSAPKSP